jgi:predicted acyltransferase
MEAGKDRRQLLLHVIRRGLVLVILGIIYNNGLELKPLAEIRFGSVLGRIGLAYMFANIIYLYTRERGQIIWFGALLLGYWALLALGAAPGYPMGDLTMEGNIVSWLDRMVMPGHLYLDIHDPEGLFSTIPAISTALLGIYAGNLLKNNPMPQRQKVLRMLIMGVTALALAQLWNLALPINKNLWTSSFVLQCGGLSLLLLSGFYYLIDVLGYQRWAFFFKIIGMNSILIYLSGLVIDWEYATRGLFTWLGQLAGEPYSIVVLIICGLAVKWAFLYFLYRKGVFLKV